MSAAVVYAGVRADDFESSNVAWFQYDYGSQTLRVAFHSGGEYAYDGVPPDVVEEWCEASSKGRFHAANIKWAYNYHRL